MDNKSNKATLFLKFIIALFITYYAVEDISDMFTDSFDPTFPVALYIVSNFFMFILAWSLVFKKIEKIKMLCFLIFCAIAFLMSFYNEEVSLKLDKSDCIAALKSWDTIENKCRYDCASWTEEEGCAKMFDKVDEFDDFDGETTE